jgi:hypothetical protein
MPSPGVILASQDAIGWTCPFKASWPEIVKFAKMVPHPGIDSFAAAELKGIAQKMADRGKSGDSLDPSYFNVLSGKSIDSNNNVTYVEAKSRRLLTFLRRLPPEEWQKFWDEFQSRGFMTPVGQMSAETKFDTVVRRAAGMVPAAIATAYAQLLNPAALVVVVGVFVALAASPAKIVPMIRNAFLGFGFASQFFGYADDFATFVINCQCATSDADLDKSAKALASLLASIARDISIAALMEFLSALKQGRSAWKDAAGKGEAKAPKPVTPTDFEKQTGMWGWHLEGWMKWAKNNKALVVLRAGNPESLPYHFDELISGKVVDVKWKTAKTGPHTGLVVVPENVKLPDIDKLKKLGYKFKPPPESGGVPKAGSLLIGPDGRAFCGDVDKMGIYIVDAKGHATAHPDWAAYNDNPALRQRLQSEVYKGGPEMDHHGGQDFFQVGVDPSGKPIMGRQPEPTEKFTVVDPDGTVFVVNLTQLKALYHQYGIRWPYNV